MLKNYIVVLQKAPFRHAKEPISWSEKHHIAPRNRLFRNAKWALLESETSDFGLCYRVYQKTTQPETAYITSVLTFICISFAKIFCQNKIKKIHSSVV